LRLVAEEGYGLPVNPEYRCRFGMNCAFSHQIGDRGAPFEVRIYADQRLRPKAIALVNFLYLAADVRRPNLRE
jgi:hypothetical protein